MSSNIETKNIESETIQKKPRGRPRKDKPEKPKNPRIRMSDEERKISRSLTNKKYNEKNRDYFLSYYSNHKQDIEHCSTCNTDYMRWYRSRHMRSEEHLSKVQEN